MRLQDKVALITGASSGIGQAIATRFAAEGAKVIINYRPNSPKDADSAQSMAATIGANALAVAADVSQRTDVVRMMQQAVLAFGRLDIAVNNPGIEIKK